jgi:hypothetical protein
MNTNQVLFLTKEQCKKKGNGIHLTPDQLNWLRGVVSNDTEQSGKDKTPQPISEPKFHAYTTHTLSIKKELMGKIRTFCYQHGVSIRDFFEGVIGESNILSDIKEIDYKLGVKKEHLIRPLKYTTNKKLYEEMAKVGYMTRQDAAKVLGISESVVKDYMKKGLSHIRKGRFCFFRKEDLDKFMSKMMKKKKKEI